MKPDFVRKMEDFEVKEQEVAILEVEISSETADVVWVKVRFYLFLFNIQSTLICLAGHLRLTDDSYSVLECRNMSSHVFLCLQYFHLGQLPLVLQSLLKDKRTLESMFVAVKMVLFVYHWLVRPVVWSQSG